MSWFLFWRDKYSMEKWIILNIWTYDKKKNNYLEYISKFEYIFQQNNAATYIKK